MFKVRRAMMHTAKPMPVLYFCSIVTEASASLRYHAKPQRHLMHASLPLLISYICTHHFQGTIHWAQACHAADADS
jgi:hypothetical protein